MAFRNLSSTTSGFEHQASGLPPTEKWNALIEHWEKPYSALTPKKKTGKKKSKSFYYNIEQHQIPSLMYQQHNLCFAIHHTMIYHQSIPTTNQLKLINKSTRMFKREKIK